MLALHGNLLVTHGGGPTAVLNASLYGILREAVRHSHIEQIYGARFGTDGLIQGNFIDLGRASKENIDALPYTPGSALGSSRRRLEAGDYERILKNLKARNIRFVFFTGGNGSMLAAGELARVAAAQNYDIRVIGVPKTVDNDLLHTDHTPGYGSAARYLAITALELGWENESLPFPIEIMETIGRDAGWLAAATVLAARGPEEGPQLVYVPEIPFDPRAFVRDVEDVYRRLGRVMVAACEGLKDANGNPVYTTSLESDRDGFGRPLPGNLSLYLSNLVGQELKLRVRNEKPGIIARTATAHVSAPDRQEAQQCGEVAVRHAMLGMTGMMVTLQRLSESPYRCGFGLVSLSEVGNRDRAMPREFMNEAGNYPSAQFRAYAAPLVGGDLPSYHRF